MYIKLPPVITAAEVKDIIQVVMLKKQTDMEKANVLIMYDSLEGTATSHGDVYIQSSAESQKKVTYEP